MFAKNGMRKAIAMSQLALLAVAGALLVLPESALAQYCDMLYSPNQGSRSTLRNPLIPTAPNAAPYQQPYNGQPPPIGDGFRPAPVIPGDLGGPHGVPSGYADPTHGNIFPTRGGQGEEGPWNYVPGAGRRFTEAGQQQGMFEFGQGQMNGTGMGPGGKNGGSGLINNGGPAYDATGMGPGGKNGGTGWVNNGGSAADATGMGPGGKNGGTGLVNNGGAAPDAAGMFGGGRSNGVGMGPGGKNGGTGVVNNGGAAGGATGSGPGGKNGGAGVVNNGGNAGGVGVVNNGGPSPGAQGTGDNLYQHERQPNRYDFNGPLPTVRTFARYLVILGCVSATVFMALAAWSMVMGSPYGGSRVMGAAGGLLLLLAGYTIWKIVQMNTFNANSTGWESHYRDGSPQNVQGPGGTQPNNGPFIPPQNPNGGGNPNGGNPNGGNPNGGNPNGGNPNGGNPNNGGGPIPQPPGSPFGPPGSP